MSIGCYSDNCSGVVRGQCPGYTQSNCGRYYCSIHSGDGLCGECYKEKSIDKLIEEYSQIAQTIKYDDLPTKIIPPPTGKAKIIDLFIKTIFIGIIFHIFTVAIIISSMNHVYINTFHKNAVYFNMTVGIVSLILGAILGLLYHKILAERVKNLSSLGPSRYEQIYNDNAGFDEFFKEWKIEKSKQNLARIGRVAMGLAAGIHQVNEDRKDREIKNAAYDIAKKYNRRK